MRDKKKLRLAEAQELALQVTRAEAARLQVELAAARAEAENQRRIVEENALCRVCLLQNATHTFLPCGHRCSCATCADRLWNDKECRQCPLCRTVTEQAPVRVWLASE